MKRRHQPIDSEHLAAPASLKKRFVKVPPTAEPLPCKFKLLRHWELTEEASRFLSMGNKIEEQACSDRTTPQLALVLY